MALAMIDYDYIVCYAAALGMCLFVEHRSYRKVGFLRNALIAGVGPVGLFFYKLL